MPDRLGQRFSKAAQGVPNASTLRVAPPLPGGYCPRPGCGKVLLLGRDGPWCWCGYAYYSVARPLLIETAVEPLKEIGRWR